MNFMTSGNKKVATACIDRIQAGGGTNLSAGLFRAIDHHQQQPSASGTSSRKILVHDCIFWYLRKVLQHIHNIK